MKNIGIFLGTDANAGGLFQYSRAILEALAHITTDRTSIVAAYFNPKWRAHVDALGLVPLQLHHSGLEPLSPARVWRSACLPIGLWRCGIWRCDPIARALRNQDCAAWIFPAQDHWTYLAPVDAIATIHDLMHRYQPQFPEVSQWGRRFVRDYRFRNICRSAKAVLVDSEVGAQQVCESYGLNKERLFALPYLPPSYIFDSNVPADFDRRFPLPAKFIWYPAQFWAHKNHERLVRAVALVKQTCPDIALVLAGAKRHRYPHVARLIEELGMSEHVSFVGYVPDEYMPGFYRRAHGLIMPTFFGPTNIPPLEAFACGCAVAISNLYGMPEQVGDAALLFDPASEDEMADAIRKLWFDDDFHALLVSRGYERSKFWDQRAFRNRLQTILERVVDGGIES